jgi:hypothetical protein
VQPHEFVVSDQDTTKMLVQNVTVRNIDDFLFESRHVVPLPLQ